MDLFEAVCYQEVIMSLHLVKDVKV